MAIVLRDLQFAYGSRRVLKSINLHVPKGEIWALVGRSGAGKTTLLHIIAGLYRATSGEVAINGRGSGPGCIRGVVFQDECLLGWLTVEQNILFPDYRRPSFERQGKAKQLLRAVGLSDRTDSYPSELSAGMRKRLEFARALMADTEYILADEPFGTIDAVTRRELWRLWRKLRQDEPRTGILCTHDPEEAVRLCDVVVALCGGEPSICNEPIRIPKGVGALGIDSENKELWALKQQVIESLSES